MNRNNPDLGAEDAEVLVEDLFIEDYQPPLPLADTSPEIQKPSRLNRMVRPIRANAWPLLGGLAALAGLALVRLLFRSGRRRKVSKVTPLSRLFLRLGIAH